jgi:hypothetical protein
MSAILDFLTNGLSQIVKPITDIYAKKEERKIAHDAIIGQLNAAQQAGQQEVIVNDQHLDAILAAQNQFSWKDEYVTVSVVGIINAIMLGGILSGFGKPAFLEGAITGIKALAEVLQNGGNLGEMLKYTVYAAIGLNVWRKF